MCDRKLNEEFYFQIDVVFVEYAIFSTLLYGFILKCNIVFVLNGFRTFIYPRYTSNGQCCGSALIVCGSGSLTKKNKNHQILQ